MRDNWRVARLMEQEAETRHREAWQGRDLAEDTGGRGHLWTRFSHEMIFGGPGSIWTQTGYWLAEKFRMIFKSSANKVFEYGVVQALNSPSLCFVLLPTAGEAGRRQTRPFGRY